ncbi:flagellar protein FlaG [Phytopseudomonas seleniipraecipitans]|uniref:Flagellar protein FlaG n=1 Tax=Phytopseudomonas seleniipraecipitans TaxID=640205 RepID=A0A1G7NC03_9GAMM|nr:flagellar protein FlaG [Pseudomonas seleniipraecipitans]SDF71461.1 flagellar protein FlaG [Pseudomonas seleniipraecipitans]
MDISKVAGNALVQASATTNPGSPKAPGVSSVSAQAPEQDRRAATSRSLVDSAVVDIHSQIQNLQRDLNFSVDDSTGDVVVKVIDGESGKVVRQIPSKEVLELAARLEDVRSLMFEAKA